MFILKQGDKRDKFLSVAKLECDRKYDKYSTLSFKGETFTPKEVHFIIYQIFG